jgi:hypothetical protein
MPLEQVTDTLLHELSHIVFGPHDHNFNNLWNELRDEHQSLLAKGYTGEGFLGSGQKLGGKRIPLDEMRRQARIAAEKRAKSINLNAGGHRLGGHKPAVRGVDMRKVIADAATRRNSITTGCASGSDQAGQLNNRAVQGGFRTRADEDDANDVAIAQALQELMEEEEMAKLEQLCAPNGGGGLAWDRENGLQFDSNPRSQKSSSNGSSASKRNPSYSLFPPSKPSSSPPTSPPRKTNSQGRPVSRLVTESQSQSITPKPTVKPPPRLISQEEQDYRNKTLPPSPPPASPPPVSTDPSKWACPQCTLLNPLEYLACDACGLEQPPQPIPHNQRFGSALQSTSLPKPPPAIGLRGPGALPFEPAKGRLGWNCLNCGTFMENQWWTCTLCGVMKADS